MIHTAIFRFALPAACLVLAAMVFLIWLSPLPAIWIEEDGPVEYATFIMYIACLVLCALAFRPHRLVRHWYVPLLILSLAMRELDWDKQKFTLGLLKSRQYLDERVPFVEKLVAIAILLLILTALYLLVVRHGRDFVTGLRRFDLSAVAVFLAFGLAGFSKTIDGIVRKLAPFGLEASDAQVELAAIVEEVAELGIPIMLGIALSRFAYERYRTTQTASPQASAKQ